MLGGLRAVCHCRSPEWVKTGKAQREQMFSALPPEADCPDTDLPAKTPHAVRDYVWHLCESGRRDREATLDLRVDVMHDVHQHHRGLSHVGRRRGRRSRCPVFAA
jgi:hypothetical protein